MILHNYDNLQAMSDMYKEYGEYFDLVYADCIYEDTKFTWVFDSIKILKPNGIFIVQTDYHTVAYYKNILDGHPEMTFLNWAIYKQEWGGISKRYFPRKHDDILIYAKGNDHKFRYERVMISKATAGTALDKRGDGLKIPCDVFDDLGNFHTMDKERVKGKDGKNIQWQKPLKLMNRLLLPFTDEGNIVLDPFMGTATTGVWCARNKRRFVGVEDNNEIFNIAFNRLVQEVPFFEIEVIRESVV